MKDEKKKKINEIIKFIIPALLLFFIGASMLGGLSYYEYYISNQESQPVSGQQYYSTDEYNSKNNDVKPQVYKNIIQPIIYNVAIIMIVLSVGTMIFELFGYLTFFRKRIAEVFTDKQLVNILDTKYKKELKYNLLQSIYKLDTEDRREILNLFDNQLSDVLQTYYYNLYDLHMECEIIKKEEQSYILKRITKHLELKEMDSEKTNFFKCLVDHSCKDIEEFSDSEILKINSVKINNTVLKEDDYVCNYNGGDSNKCKLKLKRHKKENSNVDNNLETEPYQKRFIVDLAQPVEIKDLLIVDVDYSTIVPIEDKFFSQKCSLLCKELRATVGFKKEEFEVLANGFKFSTTPQSAFKINNYETLTEVHTRNWLLPGEGLIFTFFRK